MINKGSAAIGHGPRSVLLIQMGDIGDIVLSLPCAKAIRDRFPRAHITMAVRPKAGDLLTCCPQIDETVWVDDQKQKPLHRQIASQWHFFRNLRQRKYGLAIDLRLDSRGAILCYLSGARRRIGFYAADLFWRNLLFTDLASPTHIPGSHMATRYATLLKEYGIGIEHPWPAMEVPSPTRAEISERLERIGPDVRRPLMVIQPFSLWRYKEWGDEKFLDLMHRLSTSVGGTIILVGSPAERERAEKIVAESPERTFNWAGRTTLAQLAGLLAEADLFIGLDSAGMHIAAAVGTATVTIFGPSSAVDWAPRGGQHTSVRPDRPCSPCSKKGCQGSEISDCLLELPVEQVMEAVRDRLRLTIAR